MDEDTLTYGINDTRFSPNNNEFTWLTNLTDAGTYTVRVNVSDGQEIDYQDVLVTVVDSPDFDGDGNPDNNDTDDDNDGIADATDTLTGNLTDINASVIVKFLINGSDNLTQSFNDTLVVNITDAGNKSLVEFNWNFSKSILRVNWTIDYNATAGTIRIKDIDLTSQGIRKTVYINKTGSDNYICIADDETTAVVSLDSSCTSHTKVSCTGSSGQYTCTDLGSKFKVEGLDHSAVRGVYVAPSSPPSGGGGGGGGSSRCTESWNCSSWSQCSILGEQIRTCIDLKGCGTVKLKPFESKACMPDIPKTKQTIAEEVHEIVEEVFEEEPVEEEVVEKVEEQPKDYIQIGKIAFVIVIAGVIFGILAFYAQKRNINKKSNGKRGKR